MSGRAIPIRRYAAFGLFSSAVVSALAVITVLPARAESVSRLADATADSTGASGFTLGVGGAVGVGAILLGLCGIVVGVLRRRRRAVPRSAANARQAAGQEAVTEAPIPVPRRPARPSSQQVVPAGQLNSMTRRDHA
ncbi:MAG: hypothetical protein ACRDRL_17240 [Sciscionella sp.]